MTPRSSLLIITVFLFVAACNRPNETPTRPIPRSEETPLSPALESWSDSLVAAYFARRPAPGPAEPLTHAAAESVQRGFVARLSDSLGAVVGYKAGLTSEAARNRFNTDQPVRGVLLEDMLRPSGSTISTRYGARPVSSPSSSFPICSIKKASRSPDRF